MQIQIEREKLLPIVTLVAGVVERRQTLPILSYLLLRADDQGISLTGTDLELEVAAAVEGQVVESGDTTVPARKLLDICRALPEGTDMAMLNQDGRVLLKAGKSRFTLITLPPADFPRVETSKFERVFTIPGRKLKRILESTAFCMAQQDVRYYLNGLYLEVQEGYIRAVATDGHRMAVTTEQYNSQSSRVIQIIVPRKAVQEIMRFLPNSDDPVDITMDTSHLRLEVGGLIATAKLIDGKFPDYTKVIPTSQSKTIILDQRQFREGLNRVAILANEKYRGVRLDLQGGKLRITAHNPEQEEALEEIEINYKGEPLEIGFNVNYLVEAANAINSNEIALGLNDSSSSCTLKATDKQDTQYVVMPMRL